MAEIGANRAVLGDVDRNEEGEQMTQSTRSRFEVEDVEDAGML